MAPGGAWKGRVSSSYPGVGSASFVFFFWYLHSWKRKCRELGHLHDTLGYLSRPWSLCEHTIWATQSRHCQRSFRIRTNFESITWQIASYSPALAFISQWSGHYLSDFNTCDPEGRFHVWNQTFTDGDPRKTAMFHSFFHMSLR